MVEDYTCYISNYQFLYRQYSNLKSKPKYVEKDIRTKSQVSVLCLFFLISLRCKKYIWKFCILYSFWLIFRRPGFDAISSLRKLSDSQLPTVTRKLSDSQPSAVRKLSESQSSSAVRKLSDSQLPGKHLSQLEFRNFFFSPNIRVLKKKSAFWNSFWVWFSLLCIFMQGPKCIQRAIDK